MANISSITFQNNTSLSLDKDGQFVVGGDGELEIAPGVVDAKLHASTHSRRVCIEFWQFDREVKDGSQNSRPLRR